MTFGQVIRAAIPDADESIVDYILWGRTPYPVSGITARSLYQAAYRYKRANEHGLRLCDFCDRIAQEGKFECKICGEPENGRTNLTAGEHDQ